MYKWYDTERHNSDVSDDILPCMLPSPLTRIIIVKE